MGKKKGTKAKETKKKGERKKKEKQKKRKKEKKKKERKKKEEERKEPTQRGDLTSCAPQKPILFIVKFPRHQVVNRVWRTMRPFHRTAWETRNK